VYQLQRCVLHHNWTAHELLAFSNRTATLFDFKHFLNYQARLAETSWSLWRNLSNLANTRLLSKSHKTMLLSIPSKKLSNLSLCSWYDSLLKKTTKNLIIALRHILSAPLRDTKIKLWERIWADVNPGKHRLQQWSPDAVLVQRAEIKCIKCTWLTRNSTWMRALLSGPSILGSSIRVHSYSAI